MTKKMYDNLMEHIDDLEVWGLISIKMAHNLRKFIKEDENAAMIVYHNFYQEFSD